jgi:hypothetical protein
MVSGQQCFSNRYNYRHERWLKSGLCRLVPPPATWRIPPSRWWLNGICRRCIFKSESAHARPWHYYPSACIMLLCIINNFVGKRRQQKGAGATWARSYIVEWRQFITESDIGRMRQVPTDGTSFVVIRGYPNNQQPAPAARCVSQLGPSPLQRQASKLEKRKLFICPLFRWTRPVQILAL